MKKPIRDISHIPRPDKVAIVIFDRTCPNCGARPDDVIGMHFDIGIEENVVFGCLCFNCDFSF